MALPATDAFSGTNGQSLTAYSANWTNNNGTFAIHTSAVYPASGSGDQCAHWNADTFSNDQYSKATVAAYGSQYIGVACRCHASAATWYEVISAAGDATYFYKVIAGSGTELAANTGTWTVGDVIEIRAVGTTISWYKNTVLQQSVTDTSITSGYAGIAGAGTIESSRLDNWEGGNVASSSRTASLAVTLGGVTVSSAATLALAARWHAPHSRYALRQRYATFTQQRLFSCHFRCGNHRLDRLARRDRQRHPHARRRQYKQRRKWPRQSGHAYAHARHSHALRHGLRPTKCMYRGRPYGIQQWPLFPEQ